MWFALVVYFTPWVFYFQSSHEFYVLVTKQDLCKFTHWHIFCVEMFFICKCQLLKYVMVIQNISAFGKIIFSKVVPKEISSTWAFQVKTRPNSGHWSVCKFDCQFSQSSALEKMLTQFLPRLPSHGAIRER